jgi:Asp-tRNA(Asn)/Glu-tRNA(Gln) amidotransferase A subunit family amidase
MSLPSVVATLALAVVVAGCASAAPRPADLTEVGVADAASLIRHKAVTSAELTQGYLARAEASADLNAFITLDRAGAMAAAQRADADLAGGKPRGPLHGVPLVVKDNTHVAGLPNTAGTPPGLGSDTGGSVRIPAALSGGAGLRPTHLRYDQAGVTPIAHSRDTVGPMAQTVADVALIDSVITGRRAGPASPSTRWTCRSCRS